MVGQHAGAAAGDAETSTPRAGLLAPASRPIRWMSRGPRRADLYLAIAIVAAVMATSALQASGALTKLLPSLIVIGGYEVAFYCLTLVLRTLPVGITYAVWAGLGIVRVTVAGALWSHQTPDLPAAIGMGLIIAGVVGINLFSKTIDH